MKARTALQRTAAPQFKPGYFVELMRRHNWPPMFEPRMPQTRTPDWSAISTANRERLQAQGHTGTIVGLTQRADALIAQRLATRRAAMGRAR